MPWKRTILKGNFIFLCLFAGGIVEIVDTTGVQRCGQFLLRFHNPFLSDLCRHWIRLMVETYKNLNSTKTDRWFFSGFPPIPKLPLRVNKLRSFVLFYDFENFSRILRGNLLDSCAYQSEGSWVEIVSMQDMWSNSCTTFVLFRGGSISGKIKGNRKTLRHQDFRKSCKKLENMKIVVFFPLP